MLDAAIERNDHCMQIRMLAHTDLFAYDARYHRTCYAAYISEKNIKAAKAKTEAIQLTVSDSKAFDQLSRNEHLGFLQNNTNYNPF